MTIDFGRPVLIDRVRFLLRADYPHDSYWTKGTLVFADGEELVVETTNTRVISRSSFSEKETTKLTYKELQKAEDDSPFPALHKSKYLVGTVKKEDKSMTGLHLWAAVMLFFRNQ